ncbi:hypothetical protein HMPREF0004_4588 [Achromobacter piechaudii ATCC 43553]|uniref:Uncharacterized protein n=1 Tax=Achromobacter piechaudii ATCC 43553 TaxID=742159 RepID=D4XGJ1_9BURK|nr:hypothetical protein HMPREF0004_4588 [Achromobacter piechaudii ATCC 43553]
MHRRCALVETTRTPTPRNQGSVSTHPLRFHALPQATCRKPGT